MSDKLVRFIGCASAVLMLLAASPSDVFGQNGFRGVHVKIYTFLMEEQGDHFYYNVDFSADEYPAAITTDVDFYDDCNGWNGYSTAQPRVVDGSWHIEVWRSSVESDCRKVDLTLLLFPDKLVEHSAYWNMDIEEDMKLLRIPNP